MVDVNLLLKKVVRTVLLSILEEIPIVGGIVRIGRNVWKILEPQLFPGDLQDSIDRLKTLAGVSNEQIRQAVDEESAELTVNGVVIGERQVQAATTIISNLLPIMLEHITRQIYSDIGTIDLSIINRGVVSTIFDSGGVSTIEFYCIHQGDPLPHGGPHWYLIKKLGSGGFGEVWLAEHSENKHLRRAVKFIHGENSAELLRKEATNLAALSTIPHVVNIFDFQLAHQPYWLAMEYVDGGTLADRMGSELAMDWPTAWALFKPLLEGMKLVHEHTDDKGVTVHRDLKPANILLAGDQPRIADLGIGKILVDHNVKTRTTVLNMRGVGTPIYMPPEQARGKKEDPSDDVYALGVILWQMLSGKITYLDELAQLEEIQAPEFVKTAIHDCVFRPRGERPANAGELLDLLSRQVILIVPHEEAIEILRGIDNNLFQRGLASNWKLDANGQIKQSTVMWLCTWIRTERFANTVELIKAAFDKILNIKHNCCSQQQWLPKNH